jgi:WD40 repeat protein
MLFVACPNPQCARKWLRVDPADLQAAREKKSLRVRCRRCRRSFVLKPESVLESSARPGEAGRLWSKMRGLFSLTMREPEGAAGSDVVPAGERGATIPSTGQPAGQATTDYSGNAPGTVAGHLPSWAAEPPPAAVSPGDLPSRIGRFEVRGRVGRGGFGTVYRAYDPHLERYLALKVPRAGTVETTEQLRAFLDEARSAARLRHPHIVPIYDAGSDGDQPYIASAFVEGRTLAHALDDGGLDLRRKAVIVRDLAEALAYAHSLGIIHRDVKPGNVLLDQMEESHLTDFGLACRLEESALAGGPPERARERRVVGTPLYMSPEHWRGRPGDIRPASDQYSLGVVLYEMLCGCPPFEGPLELLRYNHASREPDGPRRIDPTVPRDLETICLKALAKHPEDRYASCQEMADDLRRWLEDEPIKARQMGPAERLLRWCRRAPALAAALGLALAALVAFGLAMWASRNHEREAREASRQAAETSQRAAEDAKEYAAIIKSEGDEKTEALKQSQSNLASSRVDEALNLCERGEVGQGLVRLAEARQVALRAEAGDLVRVIDHNLGAWRRELHALTAVLPHPDKVLAVACSSDGSIVATAAGASVSLWDAATGRSLGKLAHGELISAIAFCPDTAILLVAGGSQVKLWDTHRQEIVPAHNPPDSPAVRAAVFGPDGQTVLLGGGVEGNGATSWACLWKWKTGERLPLGLTSMGPVQAVAISRDGTQCVTGGGDRFGGTARLWDAHTGRLLGEMKHGRAVCSAAFSPDGARLLTGTRGVFEGEAQLWDLATCEPRGGPLVSGLEIYTAAFSPDGAVAAVGGQDRAVRLWDVQTRHPVGSPLRHARDVNAAAFSPDGRWLLTGSDDGTARLWQVATGQVPILSCRHLGPVLATALSPDGRTFLAGGATVTGAGEVRLWDSTTGRELAVLPHPQPVSALAWHPGGLSFLTGCWDRKVRLWDVRQPGRPLAEFSPGRQEGKGPTDWVQALAFSPDGTRFAAAWRDGWVWASKWVDGKPSGPGSRVKQLHTGRLYSIAFAPDGKRFATGSHDQTARQWDAATGKPIGDPLPHPDAVLSVIYSANGQQLLTGYAGGARLWEASSGRALGSPFQHQAGVFGVAFGPDPLVLTGGTDRAARLWDLHTRKPVGPPLPHGGAVMAAAIGSRNGVPVVLTASLDGRARLWPVADAVAVEQSRAAPWARIISGISVDEGDTIGVLPVGEWERLRQELKEAGGLPAVETQIRAEIEKRPAAIIPEPVLNPRLIPPPAPVQRPGPARRVVRKAPVLAVVDLNVHRLLGLPQVGKHLQAIVEQWAGGEASGVQPLLKAAGIDPFRDVERLSVVVGGPLDNPEVTVFVRGRQLDRLRPVLEKYAREHPNELDVRQDGGRTLFTVAAHGASLAAGFPDAQTLVIASTLDALRAGLEEGEVVLPAGLAQLAGQERSADTEVLWLGVLLPEEIQKKLGEQPGGAQFGDFAPKLRAVTGMLEQRDRNLGLAVHLHTTDRRTADELNKVLSALLADLAPKVADQQGKWAATAMALVKGTTTRVVGNKVRIYLVLPPDLLQKVLLDKD